MQTTYPHGGFPGGVILNNIPLLSTVGGEVFWVNSSTSAQPSIGAGANGHKGTRLRPWATVAFALASIKTMALSNATIMVAPGHTENISDATSFAMNQTGVTILGLGSQEMRPTFTLDTGNGTTIPVSASGCSVQNCIFVANFLSIAACFTLAAATGFRCTDCLFRETSNIKNFLNIFKSTGVANTIDGIRLVGNRWISVGTSSVSTFLLTANDIDRANILYNRVTQAATTDLASLIIVSTGVLTGLECGYNMTSRKASTSTAALISVAGSTSTGFVYNNYVQTLDTSSNVVVLATSGLSFFENYLTGAVNASGFIKPDRDT